jgi:hypothetical protein
VPSAGDDLLSNRKLSYSAAWKTGFVMQYGEPDSFFAKRRIQTTIFNKTNSIEISKVFLFMKI